MSARLRGFSLPEEIIQRLEAMSHLVADDGADRPVIDRRVSFRIVAGAAAGLQNEAYTFPTLPGMRINAVLLMMIAGPGALGDPATLVEWGATYGPRTTGGELWRVFTSTFVHLGVLHLLVNVAALVQLGLLVERVVGPFAFGTIYFAAGRARQHHHGRGCPDDRRRRACGCDVRSLWTPVCGGAARRTPGHGRAPSPDDAQEAGACCRIVRTVLRGHRGTVHRGEGRALYWCGRRDRADAQRSRLRRSASQVRGAGRRDRGNCAHVGDVPAGRHQHPSGDRGGGGERKRTAAAYDAAVVRFRKGRLTTRELAQIIDQTIVPDMQLAAQRVSALSHVPAEDASLATDAQEDVRLRQESWRVRAEGLRKGNMPILREADKAEQASLQAFERLRSAVSK